MLGSEQLGLMIFSPLAGGYLSGKYRKTENQGRRTTIEFPPVDPVKSEPVLYALAEIADEFDTPFAAVSLVWLLSKRIVTSVILGVKGIEQLKENLKASELILSYENIQKLDETGKLSPEYPAWMMAGSSARLELLTTGKPDNQF